MLRKNVLVLGLALVVAMGWLVRPWSWLGSQSGVRSPALSLQSGRSNLSASEAGFRYHQQSQPTHWRALVMRSYSATAR